MTALVVCAFYDSGRCRLNVANGSPTEGHCAACAMRTSKDHVVYELIPESEWSPGQLHGRPKLDRDGRPVTIRNGVTQKPSILSRAIHGAAGIAKSLAAIDRADGPTIARRRAVCAACPHSGGLINHCDICGCALAAKIVINGEKCPVGKW